MKFTIDNPEPTNSFMEDYTASLAASYAAYLDSLVFKHMNPIEKFLVKYKIYWPLRWFSRYTIVFNLKDRTQTIMKGKKKLGTIKGL